MNPECGGQFGDYKIGKTLLEDWIAKGAYEHYLGTGQWQEKRKLVFKRDNYQCQKCGTGKNLNVHHITYENLYNEEIEDLTTLCKPCHEKIHKHDIKAKY